MPNTSIVSRGTVSRVSQVNNLLVDARASVLDPSNATGKHVRFVDLATCTSMPKKPGECLLNSKVLCPIHMEHQRLIIQKYYMKLTCVTISGGH